ARFEEDREQVLSAIVFQIAKPRAACAPQARRGSSPNVGGAWWNALVPDPLPPPVDLGQRAA
ncbi:hypothetical protein, partial [Xanthomonas oryzae]|uniref:hypothetical protein n=1 Tax=Xanthomonas oryzae TaxID=347 RepID=UPI001ED9A4D7